MWFLIVPKLLWLTLKWLFSSKNSRVVEVISSLLGELPHNGPSNPAPKARQWKFSASLVHNLLLQSSASAALCGHCGNVLPHFWCLEQDIFFVLHTISYNTIYKTLRTKSVAGVFVEKRTECQSSAASGRPNHYLDPSMLSEHFHNVAPSHSFPFVC